MTVIDVNRRIVTVSELNSQVNGLLERQYASVWVSGEVSNFAQPSSGHWYFSLKDSVAQVRCAMFRGRNRMLGFTPKDGDQLLVRGRVGVYVPRGEYQLVAEVMEAAGDGALQQAYLQLKTRLAATGLFAAERKRRLPRFPRQLGVVTSPTGAAVRDILRVLSKRFPSLPVLIYPVPVQGEHAAAAIEKALQIATERAECDVLVLARGGGSLEDLWPFNEETVAYAIANCPIPIVTGIGHEVDTTIADLVADVAAATPSMAAAAVTPEGAELLQRSWQLARRLMLLTQQRLSQQRQVVKGIEQRLFRQHPLRQLEAKSQRVDELQQRLSRFALQSLRRHRVALMQWQGRLLAQRPIARIDGLQQRLEGLTRRLHRAMQDRCHRARERLGTVGRVLHQVSPLATLDRGYAIVREEATGAVLTAARQVTASDQIDVGFADGRLLCTVTNVVLEPEWERQPLNRGER